ncbi:hypothetical protein AQUCO_08900004v1 [Aquilegia coerulea]|uniref:Uncharacterized protein n=1 Tax=Aquilegia coerulea TaxID=218851 RepID=A0A2G5C633_AQUCA|nr:hypothetical protein AQUCO_08900004v1 [Aquilegia coerulea]
MSAFNLAIISSFCLIDNCNCSISARISFFSCSSSWTTRISFSRSSWTSLLSRGLTSIFVLAIISSFPLIDNCNCSISARIFFFSSSSSTRLLSR